MNTLFKKIYGVEAASVIGNSMGEITEGMTYQEIEEKYGFLDEMLDHDREEQHIEQPWGPDFHYYPHHRPAGMAEDGMERHRLTVNAIQRKGGRIDIMDLARTWLEDVDESKFGYLMGPQDQIIYYSLKAGIPPWEVGRYASWPALIGTTKMLGMPIGEINACDPEQAALDAFSLARLKDVRGVPGNYANEVAAGVAAACAEALKPDATVNSVIETCMRYLSSGADPVTVNMRPKEEVQRALDWAEKDRDWKKLRVRFHEEYRGKRISNAVEILASALAVLYLADGDPEKCILWSVNFGRDCDCRAYIAGGLGAALNGIDAIPERWVQQVTEAVKNDPYTVAKRSPKESAEIIYNALMNEVKKSKKRIEIISELTKE